MWARGDSPPAFTFVPLTFFLEHALFLPWLSGVRQDAYFIRYQELSTKQHTRCCAQRARHAVSLVAI